jgi:hypothetical protein
MNESFEDYEFYDVTDFEIIGDYTIRVTFDDGSEQTINFEPVLLGPIFEPLRELAFFNQVEINRDIGTLAGPNGADFEPTLLHDWPRYVDKIIERRTRLA